MNRFELSAKPSSEREDDLRRRSELHDGASGRG